MIYDVDLILIVPYSGIEVKIIIEIGFNNYKEYTERKFLKNKKKYYLKNEENHFRHFLGYGNK